MIRSKPNGMSRALVLALGLTATLAVAQESKMVTGKQNLVCASRDVMACVDGPACLQGTSSTFDLPAFMFIDFKKMDVRAVDDDGSTAISPVKTHEVTERSLIMQGYENHHGWTMAVDRMDGRFTLSSTGPEVNFMIMGACTTL
jgi:hypothetical protein